MARPKKKTAEAIVKDIKRETRRKFSAEEKIRILLEGTNDPESVEKTKHKCMKGVVSVLKTIKEDQSILDDTVGEKVLEIFGLKDR